MYFSFTKKFTKFCALLPLVMTSLNLQAGSFMELNCSTAKAAEQTFEDYFQSIIENNDSACLLNFIRATFIDSKLPEDQINDKFFSSGELLLNIVKQSVTLKSAAIQSQLEEMSKDKDVPTEDKIAVLNQLFENSVVTLNELDIEVNLLRRKAVYMFVQQDNLDEAIKILATIDNLTLGINYNLNILQQIYAKDEGKQIEINLYILTTLTPQNIGDKLFKADLLKNDFLLTQPELKEKLTVIHDETEKLINLSLSNIAMLQDKVMSDADDDATKEGKKAFFAQLSSFYEKTRDERLAAMKQTITDIK